MSTDRELLELAARAAGVKGTYQHWEDSRGNISCGIAPDGAVGRLWWNPLKDDGEALRLAVELRICIEFFGVYKQAGHNGVCCTGILQGQPVVKTDYAKQDESVSAATRRAIVRAAAEIALRATPQNKE